MLEYDIIMICSLSWYNTRI